MNVFQKSKLKPHRQFNPWIAMSIRVLQEKVKTIWKIFEEKNKTMRDLVQSM